MVVTIFLEVTLVILWDGMVYFWAVSRLPLEVKKDEGNQSIRIKLCNGEQEVGFGSASEHISQVARRVCWTIGYENSN